jgi:hypothetical protein
MKLPSRQQLTALLVLHMDVSPTKPSHCPSLVNILQKLVHKVIILDFARLAKPLYRLLVKSGCVTAMGLPFAKYQASVKL